MYIYIAVGTEETSLLGDIGSKLRLLIGRENGGVGGGGARMTDGGEPKWQEKQHV